MQQLVDYDQRNAQADADARAAFVEGRVMDGFVALSSKEQPYNRSRVGSDFPPREDQVPQPSHIERIIKTLKP